MTPKRYEAEERRWKQVFTAALVRRKEMLMANDYSFDAVQAEWKRTVGPALERWLTVVGTRDPWTGYRGHARKLRTERIAT